MSRIHAFLSMTALVALGSLGGGCIAATDPMADAEDDVDVTNGRTERPIKGGTVASAYPEAALLNMKQGGQIVSICSAAVIAPRVVLTAGHCVHGIDGWEVIAPYAGNQKSTSSKAVVYDWNNDGQYVDPNQHDIGLVILDKDIVLSSYPKIADTKLANSSKILNIGRINNGKASYTNLYVSKPITIQDGKSVGFPYDYAAIETIESGDSGGPDVLPGPAPHTIVAVNSGAGGGTEVLARVDLLYGWITDQVALYGGPTNPDPAPAPACAHALCASGPSLVADCDPCAAKICAQDSYCCNNSWDSVCVKEVGTICGLSCNSSPPPPPPAPSCAHSICTAGAKLVADCDACVAQICAADSYCCNNSWDGQCVSEVGSICGSTCN